MEECSGWSCREGGARVSTNVMVRYLDVLAPQALDSQQLEVVAEGFPLFRGMHAARHRRHIGEPVPLCRPH